MKLNPKNLNWIGVRFLDPIGRVFYRNGHYYRAIYPEKAAYVKSLFDTGIVQKLTDANLLFPIEFTDIEVDGFEFVLRTDEAEWDVPVYKYPFSSLFDAAICWLTIDSILARQNLSLIDSHYGNIVLSGNRPKWIDLGSIQPCNQCSLGLLEFLDYFLHPLLILSAKRDLNDLMRLIMKGRGIHYKECSQIIGLHIFRIPLISIRLLVRASSKVCRLSRLDPARLRSLLTRMLMFFLNFLKPSPPKDVWADYGTNSIDLAKGKEGKSTSEDPRDQQITQLIRKIQPFSVIDAGASSGHFSRMIAPLTQKVLAFDTSEYAIDQLVAYSKDLNERKITACIDDFHNNNQVADLVLALAITHHIALGQQFKFDYISQRLSEMTRNGLITEFMPNGLGTLGKIYPEPLPSYYKLETFLAELRHFFTDVEVIDYQRSGSFSPRILIHCSGKFSS